MTETNIESGGNKPLIERLIDMWSMDSVIGGDIAEETRKVGILHNKYFSLLLKTKRKVLEFQEQLDHYENDRSMYLTNRASESAYKNRPNNLIVSTASDLKLYLNADIRVRELKSAIAKGKEAEEALNEIIRQINDRPRRLKTIADYERFKSGTF